MKFFVSSFLIIFSLPVFAKNIIVRFKDSKHLTYLQEIDATPSQSLSKKLNLYLFSLKSPQSLAKSIEMIKRNPQVKYVQEDHPIQERETIPDDTFFSKQWSLNNDSSAGINATQSWDYGTGGHDIYNNEIVVAIIDGGFDIHHTSLKENIWVNKNEIPGNNIDDDQNSYVDDINGWNAYSDNGDIRDGDHGTHVAGIVGAKGNDSLAVTGVNWNVKIMTIPGSGSNTSTVMKAYTYALDMKQLWLDSHGKKGANVVVTNSSFGIDKADCNSDDYPVWNDMYNALGELGILSAAATMNRDLDVDKVGDVPTGCNSPYIIAVTNTKKDGTKYKSAAIGLVNVDLGAPGTLIYSSVPNNRYANKTGTSMATPHVAGAVALLHSQASSRFIDLFRQNPANGALMLKSILLDTVSPQHDLKGKTVSGGRLNLEAATRIVNSY